jgi:hypothetical protein
MLSPSGASNALNCNRRQWATAASLSVHAAVLLVYVFFATQGRWRLRPDDPQRVSYDMPGDALLAAHTYLPIEPKRELLAMPDPLDPAHAKLTLEDASLYGGRYYLYFGPTPALVHAAWRSVTGHRCYASVTGLIYGFGTYLLLCWLTSRLATVLWPVHCFTRTLPLLYLGIGLGGIQPLLEARPSIYHEALLAGSFFVLLGYRALLGGNVNEAPSVIRAALGGFLLAVAFAARYSLAPYVMAAGVAMLALSYPRKDDLRRRGLGRLVAFAAPIALVAICLGVYNTVRFERPWRMGGQYQLTDVVGGRQRVDPSCFGRNVRAYFTYWPGFIPFYPYLLDQDVYELEGEPRWIREGSFAALPLICPLLPLTLLGVWTAARRLRGAARAMILALRAGGLAAMMLILCLGWAAMRYVQDFLPALWPFAAIGVLAVASRRPVLRAVIALIAAGLSVPVGMALAVSEMNIRFADLSLANAYYFDRAERALLQMLPRAWPAWYFKDAVGRRPIGDDFWIDPEYRPPAVFVVEGADQTVIAGETTDCAHLEIQSLFDHDVSLQVQLDVRTPIRVTLPPGWQLVVIPGADDVRPGEAVRLRLAFPSEPPRPTGDLWPVRVRALWSQAEAPMKSP